MTANKGYRLAFYAVLAVLTKLLGAQAGPLIGTHAIGSQDDQHTKNIITRGVSESSSASSSLTDAEIPAESSPSYFLSTLLAQTSRAQTATVQTNTATNVLVRIEDTVVRIASVTPSSATSVVTDIFLTAQEGLTSASDGHGQAQGSGGDCTRAISGGNVDFNALMACFSFEPVSNTEPDVTSTRLSTFSQDSSSTPSMTPSQEPTKSSPGQESSTAILHASLQQEGRVSSTSASEQAQVTMIDTSSQNATEGNSGAIPTSFSPSQALGTAQSNLAATDPEVTTLTGQPEPTTAQSDISSVHVLVPTSNVTDLSSKATLLPLITGQGLSAPGGYGGVANATMLPEVLETVTYTTTSCPSGARI